jgi:transposase
VTTHISEASDGTFRFGYQRQAKRLKQACLLDPALAGLKTNLPKKEYPLSTVLELYKGQNGLEQRIKVLKGPLAVNPIFLQNTRRIVALVSVLVLALMIYSLLERQVRAALHGEAMRGLLPENRPSQRPTARQVLRAFEHVQYSIVVFRNGSEQVAFSPLTPVQRSVMKLLSISPTTLRTLKKRCGT